MKYKVLKEFKDIDGSKRSVGDIVEFSGWRANALRRHGRIGRVPDQKVKITEVKQDKVKKDKKSMENATKRGFERADKRGFETGEKKNPEHSRKNVAQSNEKPYNKEKESKAACNKSTDLL